MSQPTPRKSPEPTRTLFWCELVCRHCNDTVSGQWVASRVPIRSMKLEAARHGWVFEGIEAFCCEAHRVANQADEGRLPTPDEASRRERALAVPRSGFRAR